MKWLSENNVYIAITRRWMGNKESGVMDVYQLYMDVNVDGTIWQWGYLIVPDSIHFLQEFIKKGIKAFKNGLKSK